jgi:hypothetical protein
MQLAANRLYPRIHARSRPPFHGVACLRGVGIMSPLKVLQRTLTCVDLPWVPRPLPCEPALRRLRNRLTALLFFDRDRLCSRSVPRSVPPTQPFRSQKSERARVVLCLRTCGGVAVLAVKMVLIQLFDGTVRFRLTIVVGIRDLLLCSHKLCAAFMDELGCCDTQFTSTMTP